MVAITPLILNSLELTPSKLINEALTTEKSLDLAVEKYLSGLQGSMEEENIETTLASIMRLTIVSETESEVYYICQPSQNQQRMLPTAQKQSNNLTTQTKAGTGPSNGSKWSTDDHEQLKKLLLQYGYGRWKQIQRSSVSIGSKL